MKVAVCLSGEPRQYKFCKDSHFEYILNKYECDTFFATPSYEGNYTAWTGEQLEKTIVDVDDLLDIYKPIKYEILDPSNYPDYKLFHTEWDVNSPQRNKFYSSWRQWYMIMKSFEQIDNIENYDIIVRLRFDLLLDYKIDLRLRGESADKIWSCHDSNDACGSDWMPDRIVWGVPSLMKKWMTGFMYIEDYWEWHNYTDDSNRELIAENLNHFHCIKQGLEYELYKDESGQVAKSINHYLFKTELGVNNYKLLKGITEDRNE